MTPTRVEFTSGAITVVGHLYRAEAAPRSCVVLCTGFGGTQDTPSIRAVAQTLAAHGHTALTFDYRHFGLSAGEPRQLIDINGQLTDIHAAVAFARDHVGVGPDRVVLWGTSLGGGHVVTAAADDPQIAAVIAQVPFNGFPRRVEGRSVVTTARVLAAMFYDRLRGALSLSPHYIPAVSGPNTVAVMASHDAQQVISKMDSPTWRNRVAPRALLDMMRYRPGRSAPRLAMPVLVCLGEFDRETPEDSAAQIATAAPHGTIRRYPVAHFDFYRPEVREQVLADQLEFLDTVLPGAVDRP